MNYEPAFEGIDPLWNRYAESERLAKTPSMYVRGPGGIGTMHIDDAKAMNKPASGTSSQRMGSSRYGGDQYYQALGAQSSYLTPTMERPTMGAMPTYNAPEMDRGRISELTELGMGAPMGKLRSGLNQALVESRYSDNPNVRGLQKKGALSGYGSGVSDIRLGAHRTAMNEYMPEFQAATQKAGAEYQGGLNRMNLQFQADMNEYLKTMKQTSQKVPNSQTGLGTAPW